MFVHFFFLSFFRRPCAPRYRVCARVRRRRRGEGYSRVATLPSCSECTWRIRYDTAGSEPHAPFFVRCGGGDVPRAGVMAVTAAAATPAALAAAPAPPLAMVPNLSLPALGRPQMLNLVTPGTAGTAAGQTAEAPSPRLFGVLSAVGTPAGAGRAVLRRGLLVREAEQVKSFSMTPVIFGAR